MPILNIESIQPAGLASVNPSVIYILTDDTYAEVTATGYLTQSKQQGYTFNDAQMALVYTSDEGPVWLKVAITYSGSTVLSTVVSLVQVSSPGDVTLPTIANNIIVSTDTAGTLANLSGTAINRGSLQAGLSGTAGSLISYSSTAARGSLRVTAVANTGDTITTISNAAMGQATTVSIPDPGATTANFLLSTSAGGQTVAGGLTLSSGNLAVTLGNITAAAGNIAATLGSLAAGTTVTAGTGITATTGNITASAGNVIAGASGALGIVRSFPSVAASGYLELAATTNTSGNFHTTIGTAAAIGQSQAISIPDCGAATGEFLVKAAAFVNGNLVQASGTGGLTVDSGVATSNVQLKSGIKAATTGNIGGAGAGPISVSVTGLTAASVVVATVEASANLVSVISATAGVDSFDVTFSADPGATCTLNYIAFIAAQ